MGNHLYTFNGEIRRQTRGGAIGNVLTGSLATLYMLYWARTFKHRLSEATKNIPSFSLYMNQIYVDDKNISCEALPLGIRLVNGEIKIIPEEIENDINIPSDIRTSKIICELGNSISNFIKLTVDCPSMNANGWMPILDTRRSGCYAPILLAPAEGWGPFGPLGALRALLGAFGPQ